MQQLSYCIKDGSELDGVIKKVRRRLPDSFFGLLITAYTTTAEGSFVKDLASKLADEFQGAVVVGCVTTECIFQGGIRLDSTVISFDVYEKSHVRLFTADDPNTLVEAGREFARIAMETEHLAAVGIWGTLRILDIQPFLDQLRGIDQDVMIFGGGANTIEDATAPVFTGDGIIECGLAAVIYSGEELHVHASLNFGWKPLGQEFVITSMEGVHVIKELDGKPAITVYEKYLGITGDENFHRDTLIFPLFVRRGGKYIARHPVGFRPDGSLEFIADLHAGEHIRLAYGDPGEMIEDAKAGYADMAKFRPEGVMILNCYAHRMFLKGDVKFELAPCRDIAPSYGFYTYGEIFRFAGFVGVHNMMILTVGFREGDMPKGAAPVRGGAPARLKDSLLLVQRLVRFVGATTAELESANDELDRMARLDRLTKLANRGETEMVLSRSIADAAKDDKPLSVLMLDIDDFKKVNDHYGHDIGDHVLVETAKVLAGGVRPGDTAGRWGGEEFMLIFPDTDSRTAVRIAEGIRQMIEKLRVLPDGRGFTASFGVARIAPGEIFSNFYQRVDQALYEAKHSGKNCVRASE